VVIQSDSGPGTAGDCNNTARFCCARLARLCLGP
jgi:hypothetical protein